ncbi:MAG TPA: hypothetical protein VNA25_17950, partial [Phycisphaerae bacterium]|nr:hypothetical protein [Phycisphaerae bacterium]
MAATPTTLTELTDLAKDYFSNVYVQLINPETPLKAQFSKLENAQFTGKLWIFGVKTSIGGGSANVSANGTLPAAQEGTYDQGQASVVRTYTRMALDGLAIEVTKKQQGSYRPALAETMSDRLQAHDLEINRQFFCAGDGLLADVTSGGASSTTQTLENDYSITNGGLGTRHVYVGDLLDFLQSDGSTSIGKRTVTSVDPSAGTIVVDSTVNTTTGGLCKVTRATSDVNNVTAT